MAEKKVEAYGLRWLFEENKGTIRFIFGENDCADVDVESVGELAAVADILRNEDEAYFDIATKKLRTGLEIPGPVL